MIILIGTNTNEFDRVRQIEQTEWLLGSGDDRVTSNGGTWLVIQISACQPATAHVLQSLIVNK